jgi:hypothetical protein
MVLCSSLKSSRRFLMGWDCVEGKKDELESVVSSCVNVFVWFFLCCPGDEQLFCSKARAPS